MLVHATAVAIDGQAVLLRGPSGSGKSDLALRLIDAGARLVADDQSELSRRGDVMIVRAAGDDRRAYRGPRSRHPAARRACRGAGRR